MTYLHTYADGVLGSPVVFVTLVCKKVGGNEAFYQNKQSAMRSRLLMPP
ncbi:hypothetical protein [Myxacorys almedinensis]|uniref:Uncharacterized protein n=1 Tax=Myxacorys almedinensis A TaxID=2690445 RepID=A0A8J7Z4C3_9CYAN|nr:hypothetical protein [Myxacorys almedinensis]NDJ19090.1 hypothetical protein [Myxacorys almedinensis A]